MVAAAIASCAMAPKAVVARKSISGAAGQLNALTRRGSGSSSTMPRVCSCMALLQRLADAAGLLWSCFTAPWCIWSRMQKGCWLIILALLRSRAPHSDLQRVPREPDSPRQVNFNTSQPSILT